MQVLFFQFVLAAESYYLCLGFGHFTSYHLQTVRRVAVVSVKKAYVWSRYKRHAVITWHGWRVFIVIQFLDNDILVGFKHFCKLREIVGLTIMYYDDPLYILKPDGLATHGFCTLLKHTHVHIVERCNNRYLEHNSSYLFIFILVILFAFAFDVSDNFPFRYCSMTSPAIGAAMSAPNPPCST